MYADIGQKSNTMIFSDKPADINALFAQASSVMKAGAIVTNDIKEFSVKPTVRSSSHNDQS